MIQTKQTCINMREVINVLPGNTNEAHPEFFNIEAMRPQCQEKKSGQLPDSLIRQFFEQVIQLYLYMDTHVSVDYFYNEKKQTLPHCPNSCKI